MGKQVKTLSERLELTDFSKQMLSYTATISKGQSILNEVGTLFLPGQQIFPVELEEAIKCVVDIGECSRKFHAFIEQSVHLPLVVVPLRLPLLIALQDVNGQVTKLKQLFTALREVIWTTVSQPIEQRLVIHRELEELKLACEEVLDQVDILIDNLRFEKDRARFEKRLSRVV